MAKYKEGNLMRQASNMTLHGKETTFKISKFVLDNDVLKIYEGHSQDKFKKAVSLKTVKVVEDVDDQEIDKNTFMFQVVYKDKELEMVYVTADSFEDRREWVENIREAATGQNAQLFTKYHSGRWKKGKNFYICCNKHPKDTPGCKHATTIKATPPQHERLSRTSYSISTIPEQEDAGTFVADSSYEKRNDSELNLVRGEQYELLNKEGEDWWLCRNKERNEGLVPSEHLSRQNSQVFAVTENYQEQFNELLKTDEEEADGWKYKLKIKGYMRDEIQLKVEDNMISVHAKHKETTNYDWDLHECKRHIEIPNNVNGDNLCSYLEENVLCIEGPYIRRHYEIKIGEGRRKQTPQASANSETNVKELVGSENQQK